MCKCAFVLAAFVAVVCLATAASAQQYNVDDPTSSDGVIFDSARTTDVSLIFDNKDVVVNPGDPLQLDCGVRGESRYCIWESENGESIQVQDVYSDIYQGISKPENTNGNECGIVINSVTLNQNGRWTCKVFVVGGTLLGSKNVIVTIKPTNPVLEIDNPRNYVVQSEQEVPVVCSVAAARPAVGVRWYLGDNDVTSSAETEETPTDTGGIYKSVSILTRRFHPADNGKILMCSITHQTLNTPANASVPVSVVFKPLEKPVTTFYKIQPGSDYEIKLNFSANPPPTLKEWRYGEDIKSPVGSITIPDARERYSADLEDFGNGLYTAKLVIRSFTEEDAAKEYELVVQNDLGRTEYMVKLSMNDAPQGTLNGGAVAGIVIIFLVVVVALVAAGYLRYRQMFCFAPIGSPDPEEAKDIREEHDTESARGPTAARPVTLKDRLGQFTQVFKKQKSDQDVNLDDVEKRSLTKDETNKMMAHKEHNPEDKEVVYAELDLTKGESEKKAEVKADEKTEYAQIVGTITDNREDEKKE